MGLFNGIFSCLNKNEMLSTIQYKKNIWNLDMSRFDNIFFPSYPMWLAQWSLHIYAIWQILIVWFVAIWQYNEPQLRATIQHSLPFPTVNIPQVPVSVFLCAETELEWCNHKNWRCTWDILAAFLPLVPLPLDLCH